MPILHFFQCSGLEKAYYNIRNDYYIFSLNMLRQEQIHELDLKLKSAK